MTKPEFKITGYPYIMRGDLLDKGTGWMAIIVSDHDSDCTAKVYRLVQQTSREFPFQVAIEIFTTSVTNSVNAVDMMVAAVQGFIEKYMQIEIDERRKKRLEDAEKKSAKDEMREDIHNRMNATHATCPA